MRKFILYSTFLFSSMLMGQMSPQSKEITKNFFPEIDSLSNVTPALKKEKGYTNYEELISFLENLVSKYPTRIALQYIGESQKGYKIPMVILKSNGEKAPLKVYLQGGLHGDEPAGTEGLLYLLNALLHNNKLSYLSDKLEVAMVPMANIDGYISSDRNAANGLDLNRDQTKLMAIETIALKKALSEFNPQVAVDFHEYRPYRKDFAKFGSFGVTGYYDVMFLFSGNLNVSESLRKFTYDYFVSNAKKKSDEYKFTHHDYFTTNTYDGDIHFDQGSSNARSSATSFALQNRVSTLIEVRGVGINRTSFKRRILTTYFIGLSYLETAFNESEKVTSEIANANAQKNEVVVTCKKAIYKDTLNFIDIDTNKKIEVEVTLRNASQSVPVLTRNRPLGYIVQADQKVLVDKLSVLGYKIVTLSASASYQVETYTITKFKREDVKYEKMNMQDVETKIAVETRVFPAGTFYIDLNQNGSSLIAEILEPETSNSFISFGVLKTDANQILPIFRHIN